MNETAEKETRTKRREDKKSKKFILLITALLVICLVISSVKIVQRIQEKKALEKEYGRVEDEFMEDDPDKPDNPDVPDIPGDYDDPDDPYNTDDDPDDPISSDDPDDDNPGEQGGTDKPENPAGQENQDPDSSSQQPSQDKKGKYSDEWLAAKSEYGLVTPPDISLKKLRTKNKDILGWIYIPDSPISYPLLQGQDNMYYLTHSYKKHELVQGSIMLDCRNNDTMKDAYSVIWGHRVRDGQMFGKLDTIYATDKQAEDHKYCYIIHKDGTIKVYQFAAYVTGDAPGVMMDFAVNFKQWMPDIVDFVKKNNKLTSTVDIGVNDRLISLACCLKQNKEDKRNFFVFKEIYDGPYLN